METQQLNEQIKEKWFLLLVIMLVNIFKFTCCWRNRILEWIVDAYIRPLQGYLRHLIPIKKAKMQIAKQVQS